MREQPSAPELIQAVADFLRSDALPQLDGLTAFHARVAVNVLETVKRELEMGPRADAAELAGLRALLGRDGSLDSLNRDLCARIAGNEMSLESPGLLQHLMRVAQDKLSVDQPGYSTYQRLLSSKKEKD
jgi:uncharacterized protein DUF6285